MSNSNELQCTRRIRSGVFVDSKYMSNHCYFGYLTHPGLEYDIAIGINIDEVHKFSKINKLVLDKHISIDYKFGIMVSTEDKSGLSGYTFKAFIEGKLHDMFIYESQYKEIVFRGHAINIDHEGEIFERLLNLN
jgi:hypothetical protein